MSRGLQPKKRGSGRSPSTPLQVVLPQEQPGLLPQGCVRVRNGWVRADSEGSGHPAVGGRWEGNDLAKTVHNCLVPSAFLPH